MTVQNHMPQIKHALNGVMIATIILSSTVYAGVPFLTDDPAPTPYQHSEIHLAIQQTKTSDGISGTLPFFELDYGVLPNVQLHLLLPMMQSAPDHGSHEYGYGDTELGIKYRVFQETDHLPMIAIYPAIELPTGNQNQGLGNGKAQYFFPLWFQKNWESWQMNAGGGYWINPASGMKNHWVSGIQIQHDLSDRLTLGGEVFYNTDTVTGQGNASVINWGGTYNFDETNHLLFSAGTGLSQAQQNHLLLYLGYQRTW